LLEGKRMPVCPRGEKGENAASATFGQEQKKKMMKNTPPRGERSELAQISAGRRKKPGP